MGTRVPLSPPFTYRATRTMSGLEVCHAAAAAITAAGPLPARWFWRSLRYCDTRGRGELVASRAESIVGAVAVYRVTMPGDADPFQVDHDEAPWWLIETSTGHLMAKVRRKRDALRLARAGRTGRTLLRPLRDAATMKRSGKAIARLVRMVTGAELSKGGAA